MGLAVSLGCKSDIQQTEQVEVDETRAEAGDSGSVAEPEQRCKLKPPASGTEANTLFFPGKWRKHLCRCPSCVEMYSEKNISFLADEEDTVHYYESRAKEEKKGTLEHGMEALSKMDRVKQVEAIHSYNNMKQNLMEYLSKFADNKKVVREEDIREFFQGISANKKKRMDGAPPSSCK